MMHKIIHKNSSNLTKWSQRKYSLMALTCWTVGMSNYWRFPLLFSRRGGAFFLIPYMLATIFLAIPLTYMELALGQYSSKGPTAIWEMCPIWKGAGWICIFTLLSINLCYSAICSCFLFYTVASFQPVLPWTECNPLWAKTNCYTFITNISARVACRTKYDEDYCKSLKWQDSAAHYFDERVFKNKDIGRMGRLRWELCLCCVCTHFIIFFCLRRGIKSLQKTLFFFTVVPYLEQLVLLVVSLVHPGSLRGLWSFFYPNFEKLNEFKTWRLAVENTLCSIGIGLGGFITIGSCNSFRNPLHMDALAVNVIDFASSLIFGIITFNALGALSYSEKCEMNEIVASKGSLLFVRVPAAVMYWPGVPQIWSGLFFSSMYLIAIRSQIFIANTFLTSVYDTWLITQNYTTPITGFCCGLLFILSLPFHTQMGFSLLSYLQWLTSGSLLLFSVFMEVAGVMWLYGMNTYVEDVHFMLGIRPTNFWKMAWIISPIFTFMFCVSSIYSWFHNKKHIPPWWWLYIFLVCMLTLSFVLIVMPCLIFLLRNIGIKFSKILKPAPSWGPTDPILRKSRDMFSAHSMTKEYMYRQNRAGTYRFEREVPVVLPERDNREASTSL